ncbi:MAG TPA: 4Fe-4S binding protein [Candidatus Coprocola pullicola]|nr:4Fe-4S binding protein [Candidatus Coprocola pullicola]
MVKAIKNKLRLWVQILFAAITNGYVIGFIKGRIFTGTTKKICVPGLNCYSCPGALGSCPIGSLQAVLTNRNYQFSFYVIGFLILVGVCLGRFVCGWLCPFGLVQDIVYQIPFVKKYKNIYGHKILKYLKYVILILFVIILPLFVVNIIGQGSPWFCKYICPSGTLMAGIPLVAMNTPLQQAIGFLYYWKVSILILLILLSIVVYRPFCKYLCPLGAIYGMFHSVAFYRYDVDVEKCVQCGKCQKSCNMDISVWQNPNSPECIRCGDCIKCCSTGAIQKTNILKKECVMQKNDI